MTWLLTTDLHLSDRPRDAYRFGLFDWLVVQQKKFGVTHTFLLGDTTEAKDRHSSALVNRIVNEVTKLRPPVYILRGNHDGYNPYEPYFRFLNWIEGIHFIAEPLLLPELGVGFIPHCGSQTKLEEACRKMTPKLAAIMGHDTFSGATAETGAMLSGLSTGPIENLRPQAVYLGDPHRPQSLASGVICVGAPYHCRFGDNYVPRVLLVRDGKPTDLHYPAPRKFAITVRDAEELMEHKAGLKPKDQVKLTLELTRVEAHDWAKEKQRLLDVARDLNLEVFGVELKLLEGAVRVTKEDAQPDKRPEAIFEAFCSAEKLPDHVRKAGKELLV